MAQTQKKPAPKNKRCEYYNRVERICTVLIVITSILMCVGAILNNLYIVMFTGGMFLSAFIIYGNPIKEEEYE